MPAYCKQLKSMLVQSFWLDAQKFGRVIIRGPIVVFIGWPTDDFARNVRRLVAEERVSSATTRPAAVNVVTGLPTAA